LNGENVNSVSNTHKIGVDFCLLLLLLLLLDLPYLREDDVSVDASLRVRQRDGIAVPIVITIVRLVQVHKPDGRLGDGGLQGQRSHQAQQKPVYQSD
jgi:hypothetical protein